MLPVVYLAAYCNSLNGKGKDMKDTLARLAVRIAGWVLDAQKLKIAEQEWHASANLIKGHSLQVVVKRAIAVLRGAK